MVTVPPSPNPLVLLSIPPIPEIVISGDSTIILPPLPVASSSVFEDKPFLPSPPKVILMGLEIISNLFPNVQGRRNGFWIEGS